jgi:Ankyrin repeats (3 copies)/Ankyrin repeat
MSLKLYFSSSRFLLCEALLNYVIAFQAPRKVKDALKEAMPMELFDLYETIMSGITQSKGDSKELAIRVLSWIFYAKRPLKMAELREVVTIEKGDNNLNEEDLPPVTSLIKVCRSFVIYDTKSGVVQLAHETVKEFFSRKQYLLQATELAQVCLTYLTFNEFDNSCLGKESMGVRVQKYKFSRYAAQFWGVHTRGEPENEPYIQRAVLSLLASENKKDSMLQLETYANSSWGDISYTKGQTLLHVIAKNGLATICRFILDECNKGELQTLGVSETDTNIATQDNNGQTPMSWAAWYGHLEVVKLLLEKGAEVDAKDRGKQTPMSRAAGNRHLEVVKLLLEKGAEVDAQRGE